MVYGMGMPSRARMNQAQRISGGGGPRLIPGGLRRARPLAGARPRMPIAGRPTVMGGVQRRMLPMPRGAAPTGEGRLGRRIERKQRRLRRRRARGQGGTLRTRQVRRSLRRLQGRQRRRQARRSSRA